MPDLFVFIHALGAAQGLFLAAILLGKRAFVANRLLAGVMLAFSVDLAMAVYHATGVAEALPHLIGVDFPLALAYGPLLYLYARTLTEGGLPRRWQWHFAAFAAVALAMTPLFVLSDTEKLLYITDPDSAPGGALLGVVNNAKLGHAFAYMIWTLVVLRRHSSRIRDRFSSLEEINLRWLRNLMFTIVVVMVATLGLYVLTVLASGAGPGLGMDPDSPYDDYTLLILAGLVYAIGFMGLRQPAVFHGSWETQLPPAPQYARSGMDDAAGARLQDRLLGAMQEARPHLDGDLTLKTLADLVAASPHHLTEVLNTRLGVSFHEFVNSHRVQEAKERLRNPDHAHLSVLGVGLDSGFKSKSSFNQVFKKRTGMTPSEYRAGG